MTDGAGALVVIPTYNEIDTIGLTLCAVRAAVPEAHVLVVDDASPDGTADLADSAGEAFGHISVLRRRGKDGLGPAYAAGFRRALGDGYRTIVEMDADGSHDASALPALIGRCDEGVDLTIGSRYVPGGSVGPRGRHRLMLSRGGNRFANRMLGLGVSDATSGFRAYRASLLRRLDLNHVCSGGYCFQIEMTYRAARAGASIEEVPVRFVDRLDGESKMSLGIVAEAFVQVSRWGIARWMSRLSTAGLPSVVVDGQGAVREHAHRH
jgi:dolichol-phosphate mannosyltransferase